MAVGVSSVIGAILAIANFQQIAEPYWFSTRQYARELVAKVNNATNSRLLAVEIATKEADRSNIEAQIDRIETELSKPAVTESLRDLLQSQLARYKQQLQFIDLQLDDLRRKQSGQRP